MLSHGILVAKVFGAVDGKRKGVVLDCSSLLGAPSLLYRHVYIYIYTFVCVYMYVHILCRYIPRYIPNIVGIEGLLGSLP